VEHAEEENIDIAISDLHWNKTLAIMTITLGKTCRPYGAQALG